MFSSDADADNKSFFYFQSLKKTSLTVFGVRFCILISEEGTMRKKREILFSPKKKFIISAFNFQEKNPSIWHDAL